MELLYKPDFEEAARRWQAFWEHELIDRPCCVIRAPRAEVEPVSPPPYMAEAHGDYGELIARILAAAASTWWGGEAIPSHTPSFGPDMMSAWLGAELHFPQEDVGTSWVKPCIDDWDDFLPFQLNPQDYWWRRMLEFSTALAEAAAGKMVVAHVDLHSNMDTLLSMRGGTRLSMDLIDMPEKIDRAMANVRELYQPIYEGIYQAARMSATGTLGWVPAYHPVRTNTIQCDYAALIGPTHFRRWALPALEEEAAYLGHCVYHLDGPECIVHLEDLCAIPGVDCIQWVPSPGGKPFIEWMDLFHRIQQLGVAVVIYCDTESIRYFHRELQPELLFYQCTAPNQAEGKRTLDWLAKHS